MEALPRKQAGTVAVERLNCSRRVSLRPVISLVLVGLVGILMEMPWTVVENPAENLERDGLATARKNPELH